MGEKAVRNAVNKLRKANIISVKQFKRVHFDHANFYSLTDYGRSIMWENDEVR